jgi:hypothetical protein
LEAVGIGFPAVPLILRCRTFGERFEDGWVGSSAVKL